MFEFLTQPNFPNAALGIESDSISAVSLKKRGRGNYSIRQAASVGVPDGVLRPDFLEQNIDDPTAFIQVLNEAVTAAGLLGQKRWSVSLPGSTARTAILTLEAEPSSKQELEDILDWKAEQAFGAAAAEMRVSRQRISSDRDGRTRFFSTAIKLAAIDEFETIFERIGWSTGLIMPRAVSEAAWLAGGNSATHSLLLSSQSNGFTALLMLGSEPSVVRSVTCTPAEYGDEVYRLLMYYHDRFGSGSGDNLEKIMVVGGDLKHETVSGVAAEALGRDVRVVSADELGLDLSGSGLNFDIIAAPAGLASLA